MPDRLPFDPSPPAAGALLPSSPAGEREVTCAVCGQPGVLEELDPARGFRISHPGRLIDCRAPLDPPGVVAGEVVVPVEISPN